MRTVEFDKGQRKHILKLHPRESKLGFGKTQCDRLVIEHEINDEEVDSADELEEACSHCIGKPPGYR
jgi:hypothetical protein